MMSKTWKKVVSLCVVAVTLFALFPNLIVNAANMAAPVQQAIGVNLLANPGFEGIGVPTNNSMPNADNWTRDTFNGATYGEIFTPEGWVTWWQEGDFKRPECKVIPNEAPFNSDPKRVYDGYYSGMCFSFYGKMNAGYYQVVRNIPAGSVVEASFMAHSWSCGDSGDAYSCGDQHAFYFRVGIDANGGTDPFSGSIVWSSPYYRPDTYAIVGPVQATVGEAGAATIFIQSFGKYPNKHNDGYYDNPVLKIVSSGETPTPTVPAAPPTSDAPVAVVPQSTATPRPDGAVVHTVVSGDTLFGLALAYGVDVDQIYQLNNISPGDFLSIGQEITISVATTSLPTPTPEAVEPTPETPSDGDGTGETTPPVVSGDKAQICVSAFFDANGDLFRQADQNEMLLPGSMISLSGQAGAIDTRTTDGISEPWCFENLEPGTYLLRHTAPQGYAMTDGGQWNFMLAAGQTFNLDLAYKKGDGSEAVSPEATVDPVSPDDPAETSEPEGEEGGTTSVLAWVLRISGIIVVILAIAVAVLFVLSRRSAA